MARTYRYREPKRENAPSPYAADHQGVRCKEALRPDNHGGRKNAHGSPTIVRLHHYLGNGQGLVYGPVPECTPVVHDQLQTLICTGIAMFRFEDLLVLLLLIPGR